MSVVSLLCKAPLAVITCALVLSEPVQAAITWSGLGSDDNLTTAANWVGGVAPTLNANSANSDVIFTGSIRTNPITSVANQSYRTVVFNSGTDAFTFGGSTEFLFNNTGSSTNASANNSSNTQTFNVDVGMRRVALTANTGDIVFNNRVRLFTTNSTMGGAKDIHLNGGLTGSAGLTLFSSVTNGGTVYIPVASTGYSGTMSLQKSNLEISATNALGDGATDRNSGYIEVNGFNVGSNPILGLTNNITVGKYVYLDIRDSFAPHIVNKSGTNEITNNIEFERGGGTLTPGVDKFSLQSDAGLFKISGNIVRTNEEDMGTAISLALQGNSNGLITGNIGGTAGSGSFTPPALNLVKDGGGDWTLSGNNTYAGTTSVNAGRLLINGNNSGTGAVNVGASGTLGGSGQIVGTVNLVGALAPGNSAGTLTVGGLAISDNSSLAFQLNPNDVTAGSNINDLIAIQGLLDLAGVSNPATVTLNVSDETNNGLFGGVGTWTLATFLTINPAFTGTLPVTIAGLAGNITSASVDVNGNGTVTLTTIPEPSAFIMIGIGVFGLGMAHWKRRK